MAGYQPLKITGMTTGLVQEREEFILPNDAYPVLENAFVWRERIKRKQGYELLGRLRRILTSAPLALFGAIPAAGTYSFGIFTALGLSAPTASLQLGSSASPFVVTFAAPISQTLTDSVGNGSLVVTGAGPITSASIQYSTGFLTLTFNAAAGASNWTVTGAYFPGLPVMGLRSRELNNINAEQTVAFDQTYAYIFSSGWQEFIPGTTWTGTDSDFFWSTNYWVDGTTTNRKIFWVTNDSGTTGDPIRYTNGLAWADFAPQINAAGDLLTQCVAMLPYRGRLVVFNTLEGANLGASVNFRQRVRWAAIGTPFTAVSAVVNSGVNVNAWRDDIRGQGGFLDIPTSEDIVSVGFVRDNIVIYCERSTWQLRYTGRSISPFQMERVNSELGAESTFSAVQFDTSLVGIGDKGIVECDSFQSRRIDIKIPDLVFDFNNENNGTKRVHGVRDFVQRLAYWTYPYIPAQGISVTFPNRRLVYNYENDSWAIFDDSLTTMGTFQPQSGAAWNDDPSPTWEESNFTWIAKPALIPDIIGGNQQGYVEYLDQQTSNDVSLSITGITGNTTNPTVIKCVNHNLQTATGNVVSAIISIQNIPTGTPFDNLNGGIFGIVVLTTDTFQLWKYNPLTDNFDQPQTDAPATYVGGGQIAVRDNFSIMSKKFNFLDEGQNIQFGYVDILTDTTASGAITLNVYQDYNDNSPINTLPQNTVPATSQSDPFFNAAVPTTTTGGVIGTKDWRRVFCPVRGAFLTLEWTLSNAQMVGEEQKNDVQIDAQVVWLRKAGRLQTGGV